MFDYDANIQYIKIISSNILLVKNKDNLSSIFDINDGYIIPFKCLFDDVTKLDKEIYKVCYDNKYRYIINNRISDREYNNISYDRGILILEAESKIIFMDMEENILFEKMLDNYYKSNNDVYYQENDRIIKHNLYSGEELTISADILYDENTVIDEYDINSILKKYKYYYIDDHGKMILFKNMKYGVSIDSGHGIRTYKWYDSLKTVYEFQKELLVNLINISENNIIQKKDKQKVYKK